MVSGRSEGGAQVLSEGVRKTIQSIKEVVGSHSDADIYVALKETDMDPNETIQKLLNQGSNKVRYGLSEGKYDYTADGTVQNYTFYSYKSGYIHQCLIDGLQYSTKYYYEIESGGSSRRFWFRTPPEIDPDAPYKFAVVDFVTFDANQWATKLKVAAKKNSSMY